MRKERMESDDIFVAQLLSFGIFVKSNIDKDNPLLHYAAVQARQGIKGSQQQHSMY